MNGKTYRWEFMLNRGEDPAELVRPEMVGRLLSTSGGGPPPKVLPADVYTFHARVAARWRADRVFLLGDAAHLAPPFAGQGLSAGLRDAANLAWKLEAVERGRAGQRLLDTYEQERRPHVLRMTALAWALGLVIQTRHPVTRPPATPSCARFCGPGASARGRNAVVGGRLLRTGAGSSRADIASWPVSCCRSPRSPPMRGRGSRSMTSWGPGSPSSGLDSTRRSTSTLDHSACSTCSPPTRSS